MNFSDKVKRSRELRGFTQQTLADEINVSKRTIAAYETTGAKPRPAEVGGGSEGIGRLPHYR